MTQVECNNIKGKYRDAQMEKLVNELNNELRENNQVIQAHYSSHRHQEFNHEEIKIEFSLDSSIHNDDFVEEVSLSMPGTDRRNVGQLM